MPRKLSIAEFNIVVSLKGKCRPVYVAQRFGVHPQYVRMIWAGVVGRKEKAEYREKECRGCGERFTPTGGNCKTCEDCQPISAEDRRAYRRAWMRKTDEQISA